MTTRVLPLITFGLAALAAACTQVYTQPAGPASGPTPARAAAPSSDDGPFEEWDEVLEDTEERDVRRLYETERDVGAGPRPGIDARFDVAVLHRFFVRLLVTGTA